MTTAFVIAACCILIAGLFAVIVERTNERDEARWMVDRLEAECNEHARVSASLAQQLTEAQIAGGKILPLPRLRAVPTQRLPIADIDIPIHTAVDDDELTALMRATQEERS